MSATATVRADILSAIRSPHLFAPWFRDLDTWRAWFAFLKTLFALPLDDADLATFRECTGRTAPPTVPVTEAWCCVGRRGGKSQILATIAVFLAVFRDWSDRLVPGESALIQIIACDRRQSRVIYRYVRAMLTRVPTLAPLVASDTGDVIELMNGIGIEITTNSYRAVRGYTVIAALCDEIAFWRSDDTAANPDAEILAALRPAMATMPNSMLLAASSPYARRGALWDTYKRHYGRDDSSVLVWRAPTLVMNPTVPRQIIDDAFEADPASAAAEFGAEFRTDIESYISREMVDACTPELDRRELPPREGVGYEAFCDPSGGSGDSMTLAIAHREGDRGVLDVLREVRPPFSPEAVVEDFSGLLKTYGIRTVVGDRYGGEWPRERFHVHEIRYEPSERTKTDIYKELLPLINSRKVELLDHPRLTAQLIGLERRTARGGRDSIDHAPGAHDDVANAAAGALVGIAGKPDWVEVWRKL